MVKLGLDGSRRRRRSVVFAALAVCAALVATVAGAPKLGSGEGRGAGPKAAGRTATVQRRDLVQREDVDGTLGYAGSHTVIHRLATGSGSGGDGAGKGGGSRQSPGGGSGSGGSGGGSTGSGTVTALAREGSVVKAGGQLYRVDNRPVILMYGSTPAYRSLGLGSADGPDVRQLERNLVALGFGAGVTVDRHFSAATAAAVMRWQKSLGMRRSGGVEAGRVVFLPGPQRIGNREVGVGQTLAAGAEVVATTSTRRVVVVDLDVAKQDLVRRGDRVTVTLPDGSTVDGRVSRVGRVARKKGGSGGDGGDAGGGGDDGELVVSVSVVLGSLKGTARLDRAPVTVGIAQETKRDALAVPVAALLARPGGGYGVEVVAGGRRRVVTVETGLFADGLVEISGRGVREGVKVALPDE